MVHILPHAMRCQRETFRLVFARLRMENREIMDDQHPRLHLQLHIETSLWARGVLCYAAHLSRYPFLLSFMIKWGMVMRAVFYIEYSLQVLIDINMLQNMHTTSHSSTYSTPVNVSSSWVWLSMRGWGEEVQKLKRPRLTTMRRQKQLPPRRVWEANLFNQHVNI